MDLVYFERQVDKMCAQHALNMLLQGHYFTAESLAIIARELDDREKAVLSPQEEASFKSQNYDQTGYFSIQVIIEALRRQAGLHIEPLDSPTVIKIRDNPGLAKAFICNMADHWFAVRKIGSAWFILNSLNEAPRPISQFYMEEYITLLYKRGHSIYVIEGELPSCAADNLPREYWIDRAGTKKFETDIERAIAISLKEIEPSESSQNDDLYAGIPAPSRVEDFEIQRALEESLRDVQKNFDVDTVEALQLNEATLMSLYESREAATSSSYSSTNLQKDDMPSKS